MLTDYHSTLDESVLRWVIAHDSPLLDQVMLALSNRWLGVSALLILFGAMLLRPWPFKLEPKWFLPLLGAVLALSDTGGAHVLKPLFLRLRPCFSLVDVRTLYDQSNSPSMPSLHSANVMALAVFLALQGKPRVLALCVGGLALAVGYSRVYVGVHWPTDVLAGFAWGGLCATLGWLASKAKR